MERNITLNLRIDAIEPLTNTVRALGFLKVVESLIELENCLFGLGRPALNITITRRRRMRIRVTVVLTTTRGRTARFEDQLLGRWLGINARRSGFLRLLFSLPSFAAMSCEVEHYSELPEWPKQTPRLKKNRLPAQQRRQEPKWQREQQGEPGINC